MLGGAVQKINWIQDSRVVVQSKFHIHPGPVWTVKECVQDFPSRSNIHISHPSEVFVFVALFRLIEFVRRKILSTGISEQEVDEETKRMN